MTAERRSWLRRRAAVAVVALVAVLAPTGTASAQSVTASQLQTLAQRAVDDPRALAQLRAVREVDGRPVDLGPALAGAEGPALATRLRTLAGDSASSPTPGVAADDARREAEDVLGGRRYKPSRVPRPLAGVFRTIGGWLQPVAGPLGRLWSRIVDNDGLVIALIAGVFLASLAITSRVIGRRSPKALQRSRALGVDVDGLDPDDIERQASAAERAGDLDRAVRLRFVAGVLRLDRAGVIAYRSSLTTGQLKAAVPSLSFTELALAFDEIAYGGRHAESADVDNATSGWPRVLAEVRG